MATSVTAPGNHIVATAPPGEDDGSSPYSQLVATSVTAPNNKLDLKENLATSTARPDMDQLYHEASSNATSEEWQIVSLPEVSDDYLDRVGQNATTNTLKVGRGVTGSRYRHSQTPSLSPYQLLRGQRTRMTVPTSGISLEMVDNTTTVRPSTPKDEQPIAPVVTASPQVLPEEYQGNFLQRQLARLNLNVLREMARMLDEQQQKFNVEGNTLRASGRTMRAEMRRALADRLRIMSERRKLLLETDVLQSQLLSRRRSARLLDLMIQEFESGRGRAARADLEPLYAQSRLLSGGPGLKDLGAQLDFETGVLDRQRYYLQELMSQRDPSAHQELSKDHSVKNADILDKEGNAHDVKDLGVKYADILDKETTSEDALKEQKLAVEDDLARQFKEDYGYDYYEQYPDSQEDVARLVTS